MLHSSDVVNKVATSLNIIKVKKIILDPVMIAKSGTRLIDYKAIQTLKKKLIKKVSLITPNIPLVNESALLAARKNKRIVTVNEFEEAKDKVMMGAERRSMVMTEDEKKLTAYHEGGHALVSFNMPVYDPIHKATIIPRGRALGM